MKKSLRQVNYLLFSNIFKLKALKVIVCVYVTKKPSKKCNKSYTRASYVRRNSKICGQSEDVITSLMRFACDYYNFKTIQKVKLVKHI